MAFPCVIGSDEVVDILNLFFPWELPFLECLYSLINGFTGYLESLKECGVELLG